MGKVIHVGDKIHGMVKEHCRNNKLNMKAFTEDALYRAISSTGIGPVPTAENKEDDAPTVEKKSVEDFQEQVEPRGDKPWEEPPFWEKEEREPVQDMSNVYALPRR